MRPLVPFDLALLAEPDVDLAFRKFTEALSSATVRSNYDDAAGAYFVFVDRYLRSMIVGALEGEQVPTLRFYELLNEVTRENQ